MLDELTERVRREMEPPWDEVREQRVLTRVLHAAAAPEAPKRSRPFVLLGTTVAAAVAIAVVLAWPSSHARLDLVDGSAIELADDARVRVVQNDAASIRIEQVAGRATYTVTKRSHRTFVVEAGQVHVHVRGTRFEVDRRSRAVRVSVEEGRVEVDTGFGALRTLVAGDSFERHDVATIADPAPAPNAVPAPAPTPEPAPPVVEPTPSTTPRSSRPAPAPNFDELLARADSARAAGRLDEAVAALQQAVALRTDRRAAAALFTLGRVESQRGHASAAATAYERCFSADRAGILAESALAQAALEYRRAERSADAARMARAYLERAPNGSHAAELRPIAAP